MTDQLNRAEDATRTRPPVPSGRAVPSGTGRVMSVMSLMASVPWAEVAP
jgi:hypothetical protein